MRENRNTVTTVGFGGEINDRMPVSPDSWNKVKPEDREIATPDGVIPGLEGTRGNAPLNGHPGLPFDGSAVFPGDLITG